MALGIVHVSDRALMRGKNNGLVSNDIRVTSGAVDATITVGAESANVRLITIQLKDSNGVNIDYKQEVNLELYLDAARVDYVVTGGSTGIAIGAGGSTVAGALLTIVAKKLFKAVSTTAGVILLTYTDTGTEVMFLGVSLPSGRTVMSAALTNT